MLSTPALIEKRTHYTLTQKILLMSLMACVTGLMAQIKIYLPFTPVPITGQTFAVLMAGILLGKNWGGMSQLLYAVIGFAGLPWFSGYTGGLAILYGPTGGYIAGFIMAAFFLGHVTETYVRSRSFINLFALMLFSTFVFIFTPGLLQLGFWLHLVKGQTPTITEVLTLGFYPFVFGAFIKSALAAGFATGLLSIKNKSE